MEEIRLWALDLNPDNRISVATVDPLPQMEAEAQLEDILTLHPDLLAPGLSIVGRQTPTTGGWLDLLGVDGNGRLVVFELKRGTLAREAAAQVVDYASYLASLDTESLSRHVAEQSGTSGVEKIDDFQDWYHQRFPGEALGSAVPPRMVLVGLGVDERTERMVKFLADTGVDISLVTFHGFRRDEQAFLARQVNVQARDKTEMLPGGSVRETNERALQTLAAQLGVTERLKEMRSFLREALPTAYEYPGKESVSFSLPERIESGNLSNRAYVSLYLDSRSPARLHFHFFPRAIDASGDAFGQLQEGFPNELKWGNRVFPVDSVQWSRLKHSLIKVLSTMLMGWQEQERRIVMHSEEAERTGVEGPEGEDKSQEVFNG